jgi:hypothetical protein
VALAKAGVGRRLVAFEIDKRDIVRIILPDARRAALDCIGGRDDRRQRPYSTAINSAASAA